MLGLWKLVHFHKHLDNKDLIIVISHCYLLSLRSYWTSVACQLRNLFGGKLTAVLEVGTRGGWDQKGLSVLVNQAGGLANSAAWTEPRDRGTTHHVPLRSSFWCLQVDGCSGGDLSFPLGEHGSAHAVPTVMGHVVLLVSQGHRAHPVAVFFKTKLLGPSDMIVLVVDDKCRLPALWRGLQFSLLCFFPHTGYELTSWCPSFLSCLFFWRGLL